MAGGGLPVGFALRSTKFIEADLGTTGLAEADLHEADLTGADLRRVKDYDVRQFVTVGKLTGARLPDGSKLLGPLPPPLTTSLPAAPPTDWTHVVRRELLIVGVERSAAGQPGMPARAPPSAVVAAPGS